MRGMDPLGTCLPSWHWLGRRFWGGGILLAGALLACLGTTLGCGGGGGSAPVVTPASPQRPAITLQPQSQGVLPGESVTLTVSVTGDGPFVYRWMKDSVDLGARNSSYSIGSFQAADAGSYTVLVQNAAGDALSSPAVLTLLSSPTLAFGDNPVNLAVGVPVALSANYSGPALTWSCDPPLPAGLSLGSSERLINGTPQATSHATLYTLTGVNGSRQFTLHATIGVERGLLLDLGHTSKVTLVRSTGDRVLSQDEKGRWILWNFTTGVAIARGQADYLEHTASYLPVDMAGGTLVVQGKAGFELRSTTDGQVLGTVASQPAGWKLATDGSYLCANSSTSLTAWAPDGQVLCSRPGDYSTAKVFAAPGEIRIAQGPAGSQVLEWVSIPSGTATSSPALSGTFHSWSVDGDRVLTNLGNTVWIYSKAGVQQGILALPSVNQLLGVGNWICATSGTGQQLLNVYPVGSDATPVASYPVGYTPQLLAFPGGFVFASGSGASPELIDLSGSTPVSSAINVPADLSALACASSSSWLAGQWSGTILDGASLSGTPRYFGYGSLLGLAAGNGRVAAATRFGGILLLDADTGTLEGTLPFRVTVPPGYTNQRALAMSADGTVLAAMGNDAGHPDGGLVSLFSLPSGTLINRWVFPITGGQALDSFALAQSGQMVGLVTTLNHQYYRQVVPASGGAITLLDTQAVSDPPCLSPDGTRAALAMARNTVTVSSNLFLNGSLTTALAGSAVGWLDDSRLLLNKYTLSGGSIQRVVSDGCVICDPAGTVLATLPVPEMWGIVPIGADRMYSLLDNTIYSTVTGAALWKSVHPFYGSGLGAVGGSRVVFQSPGFLISVSY